MVALGVNGDSRVSSTGIDSLDHRVVALDWN
jgi:hypothetical protein